MSVTWSWQNLKIAMGTCWWMHIEHMLMAACGSKNGIASTPSFAIFKRHLSAASTTPIPRLPWPSARSTSCACDRSSRTSRARMSRQRLRRSRASFNARCATKCVTTSSRISSPAHTCVDWVHSPWPAHRSSS